MATVVETANKYRVHFEGTDDQATAFVEAHAPRPHVDNGRAVYIIHVIKDDGSRAAYNGPEDANAWVAVDENGEPVEEETPEPTDRER